LTADYILAARQTEDSQRVPASPQQEPQPQHGQIDLGCRQEQPEREGGIEDLRPDDLNAWQELEVQQDPELSEYRSSMSDKKKTSTAYSKLLEDVIDKKNQLQSQPQPQSQPQAAYQLQTQPHGQTLSCWVSMLLILKPTKCPSMHYA
jgi:hypothetical protein